MQEKKGSKRGDIWLVHGSSSEEWETDGKTFFLLLEDEIFEKKVQREKTILSTSYFIHTLFKVEKWREKTSNASSKLVK